MTKLMNMLPMMLKDTTTTKSAKEWAGDVFDALQTFLVPFLIILCGVGLIWAVVVGVQMIKADSKDKMEENKKRLINIGISLVAVIALIAVFYALKNWIVDEDLVGNAEKWVTSIGYMIKK